MLFADFFTGLEGYGYFGIILYMVLTGCGLPTPEEVAIIGGGVASATGSLDWRLTLASLLIGALLGDCVMYAIGYFFGQQLLQKNRIWKRVITPEREHKIEELLNKHGVKVLFGARFLVGLRGPMYITAGILKMPFKRFVLADLFCATIVVSLFFGISYFFGKEFAEKLRAQENLFSTIVKAALVLVALVLVWLYLRRRKEFKAAFSNDKTDEKPAESQTVAGKVPSIENSESKLPGTVKLAGEDTVSANGQPPPTAPVANPAVVQSPGDAQG